VFGGASLGNMEGISFHPYNYYSYFSLSYRRNQGSEKAVHLLQFSQSQAPEPGFEIISHSCKTHILSTTSNCPVSNKMQKVTGLGFVLRFGGF
jgi:hypothetical protein